MSRLAVSSGWLPAAILAIFTTVVLAAYDTPMLETAIFGSYVVFGIALPGMLWLRLLRGRSAHVSEDLAIGLAVGYCLEIAAYIAARAVGAPLLFLLWPTSTLVAFAAVPALRRHWHGDGSRRPVWWSWSLAAILGYLLIYSAGTFFASHHLTGTDTPYVDMPFHLALIGELLNHVPPQVPYVSGVPLGYHWFFYAEAAATSWATGIEPVTLLYRLSGLPMFVAFVVLTAAAARRLTGHWWSGPIAVAVALFGTVAGPYRWLAGPPVFDTQTLGVTWISPTNLFGLALFAAVVLTFEPAGRKPEGIRSVEIAGRLDRCLAQGSCSPTRVRSAMVRFESGPGRDDTRGLLRHRDRPRTFWSSCALSASSTTSGVITEVEFNAKKRELLGRV
jgi:hypothetical protein